MTADFAGLGYVGVRQIAGKWCGLHPFLFTFGLVVGLSDEGYERRYCYERLSEAADALQTWDGTGHPNGPWIKCKGAGIDLMGPGAIE